MRGTMRDDPLMFTRCNAKTSRYTDELSSTLYYAGPFHSTPPPMMVVCSFGVVADGPACGRQILLSNHGHAASSMLATADEKGTRAHRNISARPTMRHDQLIIAVTQRLTMFLQLRLRVTACAQRRLDCNVASSREHNELKVRLRRLHPLAARCAVLCCAVLRHVPVSACSVCRQMKTEIGRLR